MMGIFGRLLLLCALAACAGGAGAADPRGNREIYLYQGADREARLVERAKQEGPVVLYSTMTVQDGRVLAAAFERKYGVKVTHWRGSAEKIVQRTDRKSTRLNSSHRCISYAVFCLKKKNPQDSYISTFLIPVDP